MTLGGGYIMRPYSGKDSEYRGFFIKNNKKDGFLEIYDNNNKYLFKILNNGHGSITMAKWRIDEHIRQYGI